VIENAVSIADAVVDGGFQVALVQVIVPVIFPVGSCLTGP
jgi:hypothetical protein